MELYLHSSTILRRVVLNSLITGTILPLFYESLINYNKAWPWRRAPRDSPIMSLLLFIQWGNSRRNMSTGDELLIIPCIGCHQHVTCRDVTSVMNCLPSSGLLLQQQLSLWRLCVNLYTYSYVTDFDYNRLPDNWFRSYDVPKGVNEWRLTYGDDQHCLHAGGGKL
jgi:hypothetical protein